MTTEEYKKQKVEEYTIEYHKSKEDGNAMGIGMALSGICEYGGSLTGEMVADSYSLYNKNISKECKPKRFVYGKYLSYVDIDQTLSDGNNTRIMCYPIDVPTDFTDRLRSIDARNNRKSVGIAKVIKVIKEISLGGGLVYLVKDSTTELDLGYLIIVANAKEYSMLMLTFVDTDTCKEQGLEGVVMQLARKVANYLEMENSSYIVKIKAMHQ